MINMEDIKNKEKEMQEVVKNYKKKITEMQWQYINEQYNLQKGCVCRVKGSYAVLESIHTFIDGLIYLNFKKIKKNGEVGNNTTWESPSYINKEFDNYAEYKKALENL